MRAEPKRDNPGQLRKQLLSLLRTRLRTPPHKALSQGGCSLGGNSQMSATQCHEGKGLSGNLIDRGKELSRR